MYCAFDWRIIPYGFAILGLQLSTTISYIFHQYIHKSTLTRKCPGNAHMIIINSQNGCKQVCLCRIFSCDCKLPESKAILYQEWQNLLTVTTSGIVVGIVFNVTTWNNKGAHPTADDLTAGPTCWTLNSWRWHDYLLLIFGIPVENQYFDKIK